MASKVETTKSAPSFFERQSALFTKGFSFSGHERDLFMLNRGDGTFLDLSGVSGLDSITDGRGAAFVDLDNDGDLDIFLRAMHDRAHLLLRNNVGHDNPSFRVALQGTASGRDAYGTIVRAKTSAGIQTQVKAGGSGFMAQSDPRLLFGLGKDARAEWLEVSWPSGHTQRLPGPRGGDSWLVVEGEAAPRPVVERRFQLADPEAPGAAAWRAIKVARSSSLPALALTKPDGSAAPAAALAPTGVTTIVNFWATWCLPCAKEMPELDRLARASGGKLRVVGISVDADDTRGKVAAHVARLGVSYPVYHATATEAARVFAGDVKVPTSLVLDGQGRVVEVLEGWSARTSARLVALAGMTGPPPR